MGLAPARTSEVSRTHWQESSKTLVRLNQMRLVTLCIVALLGCSTPTNPPTSAPSATAATAPAAAAPASAPAPVASQTDLLQRTLEVRELETYWHGVPPLAVRKNAVTGAEPTLVVKGQPVVYVGADATQRLVFEFTSVTDHAPQWRVDFRIDAEGVVGHATFEDRNGSWVLVDRSVAEH